jgi:hypothetical protein
VLNRQFYRFLVTLKEKNGNRQLVLRALQGAQPWGETNRIFLTGVCVMANEPRRIFQIDGINGGIWPTVRIRACLDSSAL